jgi:3-hydroxyisobutyrate dehydrogenase
MSEAMTRLRVAILGLGTMGAGMARRLVAASFPLTVYNRNSEKSAPFSKLGVFVAGTPREAASRADIVLSMVADDSSSRTVWEGSDGALAGVLPGAVLIESSTLTVNWVRELAAKARQRRCEFLDAPVTGTRPHAESGELLFLVGGSAQVLSTAMPVFSVLGRDAVHLGPNGSGSYMKLINNFVCGVQAASFAEALSLIDASGLDSERAMSILINGAPGSPLVKRFWECANASDLVPNFFLNLMAKDLRYASEEASRCGLQLETAASALAIFQRAIANGHGEEDVSAVLKSLRRA